MAMLSFEQLERARRLRRCDTASERRLWGALRDRRLKGIKFVRQLAVGPYVADFACREHRLIVEVDGASHSTDAELAADARRTGFLSKLGWRVRRVSNDDVVRSLDAVLETILMDCGAD
jgi:very-short-patch-repair endonuclease